MKIGFSLVPPYYFLVVLLILIVAKANPHLVRQQKGFGSQPNSMNVPAAVFIKKTDVPVTGQDPSSDTRRLKRLVNYRPIIGPYRTAFEKLWNDFWN